MFMNITGESFGRLRVIKKAGLDSHGQMHWLCKCTCGKCTIVAGGKLRSGHTRSCGCLMRDITKARNTTHAMAGTVEYRTWAGIKRRCCNPNDKTYAHYGAVGITICERWRNSFDAFFADMGKRPSAHSIDRINNDLGYEPSNCRWVTREVQARNKKRTRRYEFMGKILTVPEIAEVTRVPQGELRKRLWRGWTMSRATSQPLRYSPPRKAAIERATA